MQVKDGDYTKELIISHVRQGLRDNGKPFDFTTVNGTLRITTTAHTFDVIEDLEQSVPMGDDHTIVTKTTKTK